MREDLRRFGQMAFLGFIAGSGLEKLRANRLWKSMPTWRAWTSGKWQICSELL